MTENPGGITQSSDGITPGGGAEAAIPSLEECLAAAGDTQCLVVREGALEDIPSIIDKHFAPAGKAAVFLAADENTLTAAGLALTDVLSAAGTDTAGTHIFETEGARLHADYSHVETLKGALDAAREAARQRGKTLVPLAAGAGTINDLVKRAASECGLPYLCVPTAASVDGYTAYGAALLTGGFKQSLSCPAPRAVAADSAVLAAAPAYLSSSGFGDLAGKIIAGSDWLIAARAFAADGTGELAPGSAAVEAKAWAMVQRPLRDNLARSVDAARGDKEAVRVLFEGLGITGFALQYMKDSRAVSGCEHMWSHVWEMENLEREGVPVTHGHKVALGTLAGAAFTECLFAEKPQAGLPVPSWAEREAEVRRAFAHLPQALPAVLTTARDKFIADAARVRRLREALLDRWEDMKAAVAEQLPPYGELRDLLKRALCPVTPGEIGLTRERAVAAARSSQMIRKRFTVLDLAYETGVFEDVLKRMEAGGEYLS